MKENGGEEAPLPDLTAVNELTPPVHFNPASVEDDEKAATQTEPPIVDLAAVNELTPPVHFNPATVDDNEKAVVETDALNELSPPIPFNVAVVKDDENIKAAAAAPQTTQTEPPIHPCDPSSTLSDEESNINPQEDDAEEEFVEHATSSRMRPSSTLRPRGSDQSPSDVERNSDSAIHVPVAWAVADDNENAEEPTRSLYYAELVRSIASSTSSRISILRQKYQRYILVGIGLLLGAAVAVGVVLGISNNTSTGEVNDSGVSIPETGRCFKNKVELQSAVDAYIAQDCTHKHESHRLNRLHRPSTSGCTIAQTYGWPIGTWCVSQVTDMSWLFAGKSTFNEDLSGWDVSNVTNLEDMFSGAFAFNSSLCNWDVSRVTSMQGMFNRAHKFNGAMCNWNVTSVTNSHQMFYYAESFDQDISDWDFSATAYMEGMFYGAKSFNRDLCDWRDWFPYNNAGDIFMDSGCTFRDTPQPQIGPFCASECAGRM